MAIEPTRDEVIQWRRRLENRDFVRRILAFQQYVYAVFEKRRRTTGLLIRTVIVRHDVKSLESLVDKIRRQRLENPAYNFRHVKDFIGIKVVCPHPSSVDKVIKWMCEQRHLFTVIPRKKDARQKPEGEEEGGYYGYQFFAQPIVTKYPDWIGLSCEIQVKTMLEEAWDAMTHDTLYKREESVHPAIRKLARNLSKHLQPCDKDGEEINKLIQEEEQQDADFRRAAAFVFLLDPSLSLGRLITKYKLPVIQKPDALTQKVLKKYNEVIAELYQKQGISPDLCKLSAIVALCHPEPEQRAMTLSLANELGEERGDDPVIEDIRAGVYWALGDFDQAIACGEAAVEKAGASKKSKPEIHGLQAELCYWIGEAVRAGKAISQPTRDKALIQAKKLCRLYPDSFPWRDTLGFLKIVFAKTREEVREGLDDVEKAYEKGKAATERGVQRLVQEFRKRHRQLGENKLGKIAKVQ